MPFFVGFFTKAISAAGDSIENGLIYSIKTGSLKSELIQGIPQNTGLTFTAERINYIRFVAHFRSVHRGSFFKDSKIVNIRKLRGEHWGRYIH